MDNCIPELSYVIPVFNVEQYLEECIESIIKQKTEYCYEIVLVDDGSKDKSGIICDKYASKYNNISVIHKANGGLSSARNAGIKKSVGRYISFIDGDDFLISDTAIDRMLNIIKGNNVDVFCYGYRKYYEQKNKYSNGTNTKEYDGNMTGAITENLYSMSAWAKIIKRELFDDNDLFFKEGYLSEDMDWSIRLAIKTGHIFISNMNEYAYRQRKGSISHSVSNKHINDLEDNIGYSIELANHVEDEDFRKALFMYIAQFAGIYYIALAFLEWNEMEAHKRVTEDYKAVLSEGIRSRERIIYFVINHFGVKVFLFLVKCYNIIKY